MAVTQYQSHWSVSSSLDYHRSDFGEVILIMNAVPIGYMEQLSESTASLSEKHAAYFVRTDLQGTTIQKRAVSVNMLCGVGKGTCAC